MNRSELREFETLILSRLEELERNSLVGQDAQSVVELDQQAVGRSVEWMRCRIRPWPRRNKRDEISKPYG